LSLTGGRKILQLLSEKIVLPDSAPAPQLVRLWSETSDKMDLMEFWLFANVYQLLTVGLHTMNITLSSTFL